MCHRTQILSSAQAAGGTAEASAQSSEGQPWPSRSLGLQAAPGASPWARAGEGGVLACRGMCCGSEPALPTGEGKQNEWCQRMWKRFTGSSQWFFRDKGSSSTAQEKQKLAFSLVFLLSSALQKLFYSIEAALDIHDWIYFYQSFNFPNQIPGSLDNLSAQVTLLLPTVGFLFVLDFVQDHLGHPCRPPGVFSWLCLSWDEFIPSLEEVIFED